MNERHARALELREAGWSWKAIGLEMGVTPTRVKQMYLRAVQARTRMDANGTIQGLSTRAFNILRKLGFASDATREHVKQQRHLIHAATNELGPGVKDLGFGTEAEIHEWIDEP